MKQRKHKFNYRWTLKDAAFTKDKGKVFSCFACGGGSTMGYKLSGYDVIGCNEIDHRMMYIYCRNHDPKYNFLEPIQTFKLRDDLPDELYNLDILDGSPPCSTFSMAGLREEAWGVEKKFREGQAEQVLDTLFFDFIDLAKKLRPKVVIAENVKGLLIGEAQKYVARIYDELDDAGYSVQHWLLNAADMGVPQRRERVFFICLRKDLCGPFMHRANLFEYKPFLKLEFNEKPIAVGEFADFEGREITEGTVIRELWENRKLGDGSQADACGRLRGKESCFNYRYVYLDNVSPTLVSKEAGIMHFDQPKYPSEAEVCCISSFPQDFDFCGQSPQYVCGMSVPPLMMAHISDQVWRQWLSKI